MFTLFLVVIFVVILAYFTMYTWNKLVSATQYTKTAWEELDALFSQRYQVLAKLIRKIVSFTNREQNLAQKLIDYRYAAILIQEKGGDRSFSESKITSAIPEVCDLLKKYPELKDDKTMVDLVEELLSVTDQIQVSVRLYNKTATMINELIKTFPASIIADIWHFSSLSLISIQEAALPDIKTLIGNTSVDENKKEA